MGRRRGRARGEALRADLPRLRRRLGRPARRRPRRLRVGLQRPDQGAAAPAARRLPRAVHALHRLRRADARRRLPLLPRPGARARVRARRWTRSSTIYAAALPRVRDVGRRERSRAPRARRPRRAARAIKAKALDLLRGLLPAASLSHMGIYATGQAYEQLILHLLAHPLPEARAYGALDPRRGQGRDAELRRARRAARPRRRVGRLPRRAPRARRPSAGSRGSASTAGPPTPTAAPVGHARCTSTATRSSCSPRCCSRPPAPTRSGTRAASRALDADERGRAARRPRRRARATAATAPAAASRRCATASRSSPTTAPSATSSATGCSPCSGSALTPDLGAGVPEEVDAAGCGDAYRARARASRAPSTSGCVGAGPRPRAAPYALCLGYRIRYVLDLNAREAMQLIELRSGREGHPSYRAVAHEMHAPDRRGPPGRRGGDDARRPPAEPRLERILSEMRLQSRRAAFAG